MLFSKRSLVFTLIVNELKLIIGLTRPLIVLRSIKEYSIVRVGSRLAKGGTEKVRVGSPATYSRFGIKDATM